MRSQFTSCVLGTAKSWAKTNQDWFSRLCYVTKKVWLLGCLQIRYVAVAQLWRDSPFGLTSLIITAQEPRVCHDRDGMKINSGYCSTSISV